MNTIKSAFENTVEQLREILTDLRAPRKTAMRTEQLEFSFGMLREFEVNASVQKKTGSRNV